MPAIETRLMAAPAGPGKVFGGAAEDFPDHQAAGDDFDCVMQATLTPGPQKSVGKSPVLTKKIPRAAKPSPAIFPAAPASAKKSEDGTPAKKFDGNHES